MIALLTLLLALSPGKERWTVKTMPPTAIAPVLPQTMTAMLNASPPAEAAHNDAFHQRARYAGEGGMVKLEGYLALAAAESDGDYHLQLVTAPGEKACVIVETPAPQYAQGAWLKAAVAQVRAQVAQLLGHEPGAASLFKSPPLVCVEGVLFFDDAHLKTDGSAQPRGKKGMSAPSLWELHPVTALTPGPCK